MKLKLVFENDSPELKPVRFCSDGNVKLTDADSGEAIDYLQNPVKGMSLKVFFENTPLAHVWDSVLLGYENSFHRVEQFGYSIQKCIVEGNDNTDTGFEIDFNAFTFIEIKVPAKSKVTWILDGYPIGETAPDVDITKLKEGQLRSRLEKIGRQEFIDLLVKHVLVVDTDSLPKEGKSPIPIPTVGRIVHFYPNGQKEYSQEVITGANGSKQYPFAAIVTDSYGETNICLKVFPKFGEVFTALSIFPKEEAKENQAYWEYPPRV